MSRLKTESAPIRFKRDSDLAIAPGVPRILWSPTLRDRIRGFCPHYSYAAGVFKGFKEFITRGNVIDLAVGIVIGAAFGAVITQFTKSFLEPLIKLATGGAEMGGKFEINKVEFDYGAFVNAVIAFVLTAAAIYYLVVVPMNKWAQRRGGKKDKLSDEVELLTQIRDRLPERK